MTNQFMYSVGYQDDGVFSCENRGCNDENICRCYTITNVKILSVNIPDICDDIFEEYSLNTKQHDRDSKITSIVYGYDVDIINKYCINRILTINKVWDVNNWRGEWQAGWYGDEVDSVKMNPDLFEKVIAEVDAIFNLDTIEEKIDYVLMLEYGFILNKIQNKKYEVLTIDKSSISFGQKHHNDDINDNLENYNYYNDNSYRDIPMGICRWDGKRWRVLDGYHRLNLTKNKKVSIIGIR